MTNSFLWLLLAVVPWSVWLCWHDCRERRLPNALTLGGATLALVARLALGGVPSLVEGAAAGLLAGLFLLIPFLLRGAGGGDVKMIFTCGIIVGWGKLMSLLIYTSFAGLGVGIGMLLLGRLDPARLKHFARCLFDWRYDRAAGKAALPSAESEQVRIPFSLAIAMGLLAALLLPDCWAWRG